ncbi:hypothetical protein B0H13DRAFT_1882018 [Mycena leptocephala]|nr:hypothetical protein B0H13DRAFT_1882018 [Mycena leptocephala]
MYKACSGAGANKEARGVRFVHDKVRAATALTHNCRGTGIKRAKNAANGSLGHPESQMAEVVGLKRHSGSGGFSEGSPTASSVTILTDVDGVHKPKVEDMRDQPGAPISLSSLIWTSDSPGIIIHNSHALETTRDLRLASLDILCIKVARRFFKFLHEDAIRAVLDLRETKLTDPEWALSKRMSETARGTSKLATPIAGNGKASLEFNQPLAPFKRTC